MAGASDFARRSGAAVGAAISRPSVLCLRSIRGLRGRRPPDGPPILHSASNNVVGADIIRPPTHAHAPSDVIRADSHRCSLKTVNCYRFPLDKRPCCGYTILSARDPTTEHLIKSGGGNGPVKPGNLRWQGAKSGGETKDEALRQSFYAPRTGARFLILPHKRCSAGRAACRTGAERARALLRVRFVYYTKEVF